MMFTTHQPKVCASTLMLRRFGWKVSKGLRLMGYTPSA